MNKCDHALGVGAYEDAIMALLEWNKLVMVARKAAPWIQLTSGKLDVRYRGQERELPDGDALPELWRNSYFIDALKSWNLYDTIWQAGAILLPVRTVGVMGDARTYGHAVVLRAVTSTDGMTADWAPVDAEFLKDVSNRIINSVRGINRVVYDISSKPPSTIEWE